MGVTSPRQPTVGARVFYFYFFLVFFYFYHFYIIIPPGENEQSSPWFSGHRTHLSLFIRKSDFFPSTPSIHSIVIFSLSSCKPLIPPPFEKIPSFVVDLRKCRPLGLPRVKWAESSRSSTYRMVFFFFLTLFHP